MQHGDTTKEYLDAFPRAKVFGFEPERENFARSQALLSSYGNRVCTINAALSDRSGMEVLNVNSHDGTHSLFEIGDSKFFDGPVNTVARTEVQAIALDDFCVQNSVSRIDILKMDIQGAELKALRGGDRLLRDGKIGLLALEVEFHRLYDGQPLFHDVASFLNEVGYQFHRLYDLRYINGALSWADAIFLPAAHFAPPEPFWKRFGRVVRTAGRRAAE